jgi:hypothetical protein
VEARPRRALPRLIHLVAKMATEYGEAARNFQAALDGLGP